MYVPLKQRIHLKMVPRDKNTPLRKFIAEIFLNLSRSGVYDHRGYGGKNPGESAKEILEKFNYSLDRFLDSVCLEFNKEMKKTKFDEVSDDDPDNDESDDDESIYENSEKVVDIFIKCSGFDEILSLHGDNYYQIKLDLIKALGSMPEYHNLAEKYFNYNSREDEF